MLRRIQIKRKIQGKAENLWLLFKLAEYFFSNNLFSRVHWLLKSSSEFNWLNRRLNRSSAFTYINLKWSHFVPIKTPSKLAQGRTIETFAQKKILEPLKKPNKKKQFTVLPSKVTKADLES